MRKFVIPLTALLIPGAALADDPCSAFKWSLAREQAWLSQAAPLDSGVATPIERPAYVLHLVAPGAAHLSVPPERDSKPGTYAGVLPITGIANPGLYQVTLSAEAWIEVAQNGARIKSQSFSGAIGCPSMRKSVRFSLAAGSAMIEISNSEKDVIGIAVGPAL